MKGKRGVNTVQMNKNVNRRQWRDTFYRAMFTRGTGANLPVSKSERTLEVCKSWRHSYACGESHGATAFPQIGYARSPARSITRANRRRRAAQHRAWPQPRRQPHGLHPTAGPPRPARAQRTAAPGLRAYPLAAGLALRLHIHHQTHVRREPLEASRLLASSATAACC